MADDFLKYRAQSTSFQSLDFSAWKEFHFTSNGHQDGDLAGGAATPNFYSKDLVIGTALGRGFSPEEGVTGNDHAVIFSYRLWEARFHADPNILGKQVEIEGQPYTVLGVQKPTPADRGDGAFSVPLALNPGGRNEYVGTMFGRLKQGVTIAQAQAEMAVIDRRIAAQRGGDAPKDARSMSVEPLHNDWLDKKLERNLWLLLAAVGFVLLIACADLANLL
jgi:putative ABC transport system permease protein